MKEEHSCCCIEYRFTCVSHKTCSDQYTKVTLTVNEKECVQQIIQPHLTPTAPKTPEPQKIYG